MRHCCHILRFSRPRQGAMNSRAAIPQGASRVALRGRRLVGLMSTDIPAVLLILLWIASLQPPAPHVQPGHQGL
jgi:hypothetical protein